jgi:hypothetical protein
MGSRAPSERDRFWLKHHEAQQASGETAKAYAASAGISVRDLYQGRKRLRERGLLAPGRSTTATTPRFSKVAVTGPASAPIEEPRFRITLPNGAVLEWSGAASVGPVADLVERMARLP